jgi:hypothetical protein
MCPEPDTRKRVALMLEALAVFFEHLVEALRRWAKILRDSIILEAANE